EQAITPRTRLLVKWRYFANNRLGSVLPSIRRCTTMFSRATPKSICKVRRIAGSHLQLHRAYCRDSAAEVRVASACFPQHGPGGIGEPWGQVFGWPKNAQILSVASAERMCSNLQ